MKSKLHDLHVPVLDEALHPIIKHFAVLRDKKKKKKKKFNFFDQWN